GTDVGARRQPATPAVPHTATVPNDPRYGAPAVDRGPDGLSVPAAGRIGTVPVPGPVDRLHRKAHRRWGTRPRLAAAGERVVGTRARRHGVIAYLPCSEHLALTRCAAFAPT